MQRPSVTQEDVKKLFDYDPHTGHFTYLMRSARCVKIGTRAGAPRGDGYRQIKVLGWPFAEHRVAWLYVHGKWPDGQLDHINGIKTDNRIANLRLASASDNTRNRGPYRTNTAGFKGVTRHKQTGRWQAACWANGRQNYLGLFDTPSEAAEAYRSFAKQHHGEFFRD